MKSYLTIFLLAAMLPMAKAQMPAMQPYGKAAASFNFYGDTIRLPANDFLHLDFKDSLTKAQLHAFCSRLQGAFSDSLLATLQQYRKEKKVNDWIYYQLIRKTAKYISPKAENYERYTLYKWFLMSGSGYDARLMLIDHKVLLYVYCDENIYDLPVFTQNGRQYVCLNYHDYAAIDFNNHMQDAAIISLPAGQKPFSYKVTQLPGFTQANMQQKALRFNYDNREYNFNIDLNPEVDSVFKNYPVVDFEAYLNIPLSRKTYASLIPKLKAQLAGKTDVQGVDYLMEFTRNAFLYENDQEHFGKEKRLSPEQTLLNTYSDCDDRVALFFYLVKELYNRPMIVLLYPTHVSIAVNFEKNKGKAVYYDNMPYTVCDPTPQQETLLMGEMPVKQRNQAYSVVYHYRP